MSVIGKKPFVNKIIDSLNKSQVSTVIGLLDNLGEVTHVSFKTLSDANKGISHVVFNLDEVQNKNVEGILIYIDSSHCGLFSFNSTSGNMLEFEIDPVGKSYIQQYEHLTVEELRQVCGDKVADIEVGDVTAEDINSGTADSGKVLMADGSGGASWVSNAPKYEFESIDDITVAQIQSLKLGDWIIVGTRNYLIIYCVNEDDYVGFYAMDMNLAVSWQFRVLAVGSEDFEHIEHTENIYDWRTLNKHASENVNTLADLTDTQALQVGNIIHVKDGAWLEYAFENGVGDLFLNLSDLAENSKITTRTRSSSTSTWSEISSVNLVTQGNEGTKLYKHRIQMRDGTNGLDFYIISWKSSSYTLADFENYINAGSDVITISVDGGDRWIFLPMLVGYDALNLIFTADENDINSVSITFSSAPTLTDTVTPL